jgi:thiopurine S-methyltransferase
MEPDFWLAAWQAEQIGFHRDEPHEDLIRHAASVFRPGTVLVPLCGATHDLAWLAQHGWTAVGVELSPIACERLAQRDGLVAMAPLGPFARWQGPGITLLCGDIFALEPALVGSLTGVWDRGALVALHPDQRAPYVARMRALLGSGRLLLNALSYDQRVADGPPWSIDAAVVADLWPDAQVLEARQEPAPPRLAAAGVEQLTVTVWSTG